jgi:hypothetical protein
MNIPNFIDCQITDQDGNLTDTWKQIMTQLFSQLQGGLSNEGIAVPQQTAVNIAQLADANRSGALIYDEDNHLLKVNINGTIKTVSTL